MTVIQPGYADVAMEFRHTSMSRSAYITFGVDPTSNDPNDIAGLVSTAYSASGGLRTLFDTDVVCRQINVRLGQDGGPPTVGMSQPNSTGTNAGLTSLPPNCAVLVHKKTALGGRRHRGRIYLPWVVGEGLVDEAGIINSAQLTATQGVMDNFLAALATNNVPMVILHSEGQTPTPPATLVQSLAVDRLIASQRRRLAR